MFLRQKKEETIKKDAEGVVENSVTQTFEVVNEAATWANIAAFGTAARDETMDRNMSAISKALVLLSALDDPSPTNWLFPSNRIVYMPFHKVSTSEPFFGAVLESKYLKWPDDQELLPALFMNLSIGRISGAAVLPSESHVDQLRAVATEQTAFNLSPAIGVMFLPNSTLPSSMVVDSDAIYFAANLPNFKDALKFYHDSLGGRSQLLAYFSNYAFPENSETIILRFPRPTILAATQMPKVKGGILPKACTVKLSIYCREYIEFRDY